MCLYMCMRVCSYSVMVPYPIFHVEYAIGLTTFWIDGLGMGCGHLASTSDPPRFLFLGMPEGKHLCYQT